MHQPTTHDLRGLPAAPAGPNRLRDHQALLRRRVWTAVRDGGIAGITRPALLRQLGDLCARNVVDRHVSDLHACGYLRHLRLRTSGLLFYVDADCRVPAGCSAQLGPGWPCGPLDDRVIEGRAIELVEAHRSALEQAGPQPDPQTEPQADPA